MEALIRKTRGCSRLSGVLTKKGERMKKRAWLICILVCTAFFLNGCVIYFGNSNNIDTRMFCFHGKSDLMADFGKRTAYADGRIWYLSAESGTQGLHSMTVDGTDVRLEFAAEDIRSLTVRDGSIWTAEYAGQDENDCGEYRKFKLLVRKDGADAPPEDPLKEIDEKTREQVIYWDENILDFHVTSSGDIYFRCAQMSLPQGYRMAVMFALRDGVLSKVNRWEYPLQIDPIKDGHGSISAYDNQISMKREEDCLVVRDAQSNCMIYDLALDQIGFSIDNRYYLNNFSTEESSRSDRMLLGKEKDRLYFVAEQELLALQPKTLQTDRWMIENKAEGIYAAYMIDGRIVILTRAWEEDDQAGSSKTDAAAACLYTIELRAEEGLKDTPLLFLEHPAEFVYLNETYTAVAEGKTLTLYDISGADAKEVRKIELEHEIVDKANKTDCAGGWWFLYRFNEETNRDELIEKVRLY